MLVFEIIVAGFDGGSDETDDKVLWVSANCADDINLFVSQYGLEDAMMYGDQLPAGYAEANDIDFNLPKDAEQLAARIRELLPAT